MILHASRVCCLFDVRRREVIWNIFGGSVLRMDTHLPEVAKMNRHLSPEFDGNVVPTRKLTYQARRHNRINYVRGVDD